MPYVNPPAPVKFIRADRDICPKEFVALIKEFYAVHPSDFEISYKDNNLKDYMVRADVPANLTKAQTNKITTAHTAIIQKHISSMTTMMNLSHPNQLPLDKIACFTFDTVEVDLYRKSDLTWRMITVYTGVPPDEESTEDPKPHDLD
jgi:hypothetical protein